MRSCVLGITQAVITCFVTYETAVSYPTHRFADNIVLIANDNSGLDSACVADRCVEGKMSIPVKEQVLWIRNVRI